jgi:glycosyltransferase involved in cell wall biosynthesis
MDVRPLVRRPARAGARIFVGARTRGWGRSTRLFAVGERSGWSVDEDARVLEQTARRLGYSVGPTNWARFCANQAVFLASHFEALLRPGWIESSNRLATAYMHGRPGTPGFPEFDESFRALSRHAGRFDRIQVTHAEMLELVLSAGVPENRVFRIPLGIDVRQFRLGDETSKAEARGALNLPSMAFVVGSFQKDGVGWGEGLHPKLIKGPDVFVEAMERLHSRFPELLVLLTGPARGYVRRELERRGIAHRHTFVDSHTELERAYHALDLYVVASRQEGGPKAVLESMATGVPLVTTRVGQAQELVEDGRNALLADVEDIDAIAASAIRVGEDSALRERLRLAGRATAEAYAHERLDVAWAALLDGFVVREAPAS